MSREHIRNFSIIAHIDHGKSTLADRILELTKAVPKRQMQAQLLDSLDLERERGITIKAQTVRLKYTAKNGEDYVFNLIDTPGHVDFNYEVSRSLAACEGALLVVDASQGVEAQTLANVYLAIENYLEIVPVLNKIDLPTANVDRAKEEIQAVIGLDASKSICISAKTGMGVDEVLEAIVHRIPPPTRGSVDNKMRALVYDCWFDQYLGAIVQVRVIDGVLKKGQKIRLMMNRAAYEVTRIAVNTPVNVEVESLSSGEVGHFAAAIKNLKDIKIGDTVSLAEDENAEALPGFKEVQPMVFSGLFPVESDDFVNLRAALEKLSLNDAAFTYEAETSVALGFGFRCGYLGLLHMEIIRERLEREFALSLITTAPTVVYRVTDNKGTVLHIDNPEDLPPVQNILKFEEPMVKATIHTPREYLGNVFKLCEDKRGIQQNLAFHGDTRAVVTYELPLNEIVLDFHDKLKSLTKGYASFDYEFSRYMESDLVKLDIMLNGEDVDALSIVVHRSKAFNRGKELTDKLKDLIDRQMFEVAIQAAIGAKIIARSTVKALRKNVTAKCYGGDISRKRKLLEKQKEGKKRMKQVGSVSIPQEAFLAVLKLSD